MVKRKSSSNILCVKNFPDYLQADDLKQYFKEIGTIKDVTIFYDKQSRAKAYIEYTKDLSEDALRFNRATIENERVSIRFAIPQDREIIISNAPAISIDQLKNEYMSNIGPVEHIEKLSNSTYKVRFETIQATKESLDYNGADIEGQVVAIQQLQLSPQELQKILLNLDVEDDVEVQPKVEKKSDNKKSNDKKSGDKKRKATTEAEKPAKKQKTDAGEKASSTPKKSKKN